MAFKNPRLTATHCKATLHHMFTNSKGRVPVQTYIDKALYEALAEASTEENRSMADKLRLIIAHWHRGVMRRRIRERANETD